MRYVSARLPISLICGSVTGVKYLFTGLVGEGTESRSGGDRRLSACVKRRLKIGRDGWTDLGEHVHEDHSGGWAGKSLNESGLSMGSVRDVPLKGSRRVIERRGERQQKKDPADQT